MSSTAFKIGQLVSVASRTGPNENKLGGVGTIISIDDGLITVKYSLGGKESGIHERFVKVHEFGETRVRQRRGTNTTVVVAAVVAAVDNNTVESNSNNNDIIIQPNEKKNDIKPDVDIVAMEVAGPETKEQTQVKRAPMKAKMTSKVIVMDDDDDGKSNIDTTNKQVNTISSVDKANAAIFNSTSIGQDVHEDELLFFTQELLKCFKQDESLDMSIALGILPNVEDSKRILRILHDQNRVYIPEDSNMIWKV